MPQLVLGQWLRGKASAAVDISDGLLADCAHLAEASGVCAEINQSRLPLSDALLEQFGEEQAIHFALNAGDDYRLLFTLPPEQLRRLQQAFPQTAAVIGAIKPGSGVVLLDNDAKPRQLPEHGWQHFR